MATILDLPEELSQAVDLLKEFEHEKDHTTRLKHFDEAMGFFNAYLECGPDSPYREIITTIAATYTRRLLNELPSLHLLDMYEWSLYLNPLLLAKPCCEQVQLLVAKNERLKKNLHSFLRIWINEMEDLLISKQQSRYDDHRV